jgi:hypothetical protein
MPARRSRADAEGEEAETPTTRPTRCAKRAIRCCSGVSVSISVRIDSAMAPSAVPMAVATTYPRPRPLATTVAMKAMLRAIGQGGIGLVERLGRLGDRQRLAGEQRLVDPQRRRREQAQIGRDADTGLEQHDVAAHQFAALDLPLAPVAQDTRVRRQQLHERADRLARRAAPGCSR